VLVAVGDPAGRTILGKEKPPAVSRRGLIPRPFSSLWDSNVNPVTAIADSDENQRIFHSPAANRVVTQSPMTRSR
jgi:hypothetical protein